MENSSDVFPLSRYSRRRYPRTSTPELQPFMQIMAWLSIVQVDGSRGRGPCARDRWLVGNRILEMRI